MEICRLCQCASGFPPIGYRIFLGYGHTSRQAAVVKADKKHDAFNKTRKRVSDSNKEVLKMLESGKVRRKILT